MGDAQQAVVMSPEKYKGRNCYKITYNSVGTMLWAGVYWLYGWDQNAWNKRVNLTGYEKLAFYACGEGNIQFKVGDDKGSTLCNSGPVTLQKNWQLIEIDLRGKNLSSVLPFCWVSPTPFYINSNSITFYITDPVFKFRFKD